MSKVETLTFRREDDDLLIARLLAKVMAYRFARQQGWKVVGLSIVFFE